MCDCVDFKDAVLLNLLDRVLQSNRFCVQYSQHSNSVRERPQPRILSLRDFLVCKDFLLQKQSHKLAA